MSHGEDTVPVGNWGRGVHGSSLHDVCDHCDPQI